jgi:hypothetical protein
MSQQNVEIAERTLDAFNRRDVDALMADSCADMTFRRPGSSAVIEDDAHMLYQVGCRGLLGCHEGNDHLRLWLPLASRASVRASAEQTPAADDARASRRAPVGRLLRQGKAGASRALANTLIGSGGRLTRCCCPAHLLISSPTAAGPLRTLTLRRSRAAVSRGGARAPRRVGAADRRSSGRGRSGHGRAKSRDRP